MSEPVVYGPAFSTYVRTVRLALEEKGAAYRLEEVDILKGQNRAPEHLKRHPFGKVPAFDHDGFTLYETSAIARYVDAAFDGPKLQPSELRRRARMDQAIAVIDTYLYPAVITKIFIPRVVFPMIGMQTDEAAVAAAVPAAERALDAVDAIIADLGEGVTLADLFLVPIVDYAVLVPEGRAMLPARKRAAAWWERAKERPSSVKTRPSLG